MLFFYRFIYLKEQIGGQDRYVMRGFCMSDKFPVNFVFRCPGYFEGTIHPDIPAPE